MSLIRLAALLAGFWCAVAFGQVRPPAKAADRKPPAESDKPALAFEIGKEVTIEQSGLTDGHFILYVPKDYTPVRAWPLIFCYHGINQSAKVWPFKELTDGKGFIVVGMSYVTDDGGTPEQEWASLVHIGQLVSSTLKVNPKMIFIGGFSRGGGWTYTLSAKNPSIFAGVIALGMSGGPGTSMPAAWMGKPVLIAHGEKDEYCQKIQTTLDAFAGVGAQVTHEVFPGQGHAVDTNNAVCKKWLQENGPLRAIRGDLAAARAAEKAGKAGPALAMYQALAKVEGGGKYAEAAADAAKVISDAADKQLAAAEEAVAKKKYLAAVKLLVTVEKSLAGAAPAAKARARLDQLESDPQIKPQIEQARTDAAADALEAQGLAAEQSKDFGRALATYDKYLAQYGGATRFASVKTHRDTLKTDKTVLGAIAGKQMDKDCKAWMSMARNYRNAGMRDKADSFLQRIIDTYPDSAYAEAARAQRAE
jgi:dienelactone hydrolase